MFVTLGKQAPRFSDTLYEAPPEHAQQVGLGRDTRGAVAMSLVSPLAVASTSPLTDSVVSLHDGDSAALHRTGNMACVSGQRELT